MENQVKLSSACKENERENVRDYMGYTNGYFSFARTIDGSIPNRFYPTLEEAYKTTLTHFGEMGKFKNSKNIFFIISDSSKRTIYKGQVMQSGKINFSIYEGADVNKTSTICTELNKISTNNNLNINVMKYDSASIKAVETCSTPEKNKISQTVLRNGQTYLDNNILTQSHLNFLCLSEKQAKTLAQLVQKTATNSKDADNQTFASAIADVSAGMLTITKTLASGKPMADTHVSFHDDSLYCAVHCKSADALWNGSNTWRKVPGKIAYGKISDTVMDMYHKGQQLLLNPKKSAQSAKVFNKSGMATEKVSLSTVSDNIASTVMTYLNCTPDLQRYLTVKGCSLDSDLTSMSNGVIAGEIVNNDITLSVLSGQSCIIPTSHYTTDEQLRKAISMNVGHLFVGASISDITRDMVSSLVDLSTVEDYYITSMRQLSAHAA